ncbi:hypothetical protein QAD02_013217 [Eretmocerus hayati]|uniref:Uncharacterized protein n=1 Tax=Eretmocerus hayati TaxID=131215 RepID=A0ACC2P6M8_9HYME|nr:hypothetical protein QAD02_013217 [Eretmocerus hayati]
MKFEDDVTRFEGQLTDDKSCRNKTMHSSDEEFWLERIEEMPWEWDMEHCIVAIDDKLVIIQAPPHSGSMMYDYKSHHSVHLQAIFDAYQRFISVDVGAARRQSDGGVMRNSRIGQRFGNNEIKVPPDTPLEQGRPEFHNCLVADGGFGLSKSLLRPYPRSSGLNPRQKITDYRFSRARKIADFLIMLEEGRFRKRRSAGNKIQNHNYQYVPEGEVIPRQSTLGLRAVDNAPSSSGEPARLLLDLATH